MSGSHEANPFASPATVDNDYAAAVGAGRVDAVSWNAKWDYLLLVAIIVTCSFGMAAVFLNIESILFSGGFLAGLSALLFVREIIMSHRGRPTWLIGRFAAVSGVILPIVVLAVIALNEWSPPQAKDAGVPYAVALIGLWTIAICLTAYFFAPHMTRRTFHSSFSEMTVSQKPES